MHVDRDCGIRISKVVSASKTIQGNYCMCCRYEGRLIRGICHVFGKNMLIPYSLLTVYLACIGTLLNETETNMTHAYLCVHTQIHAHLSVYMYL